MNDAPRNRSTKGRSPKIRASCDSCNEGKIRCSQTRPSCAQCLNHDILCVYGISQRSGKHRAESYKALSRKSPTNRPRTPPTTDTEITGHSSIGDPIEYLIPSPVSIFDGADLTELSKQQIDNWAFDNIFVSNEPFATQNMPVNYGFQSGTGRDETQITDYQREAPSSYNENDARLLSSSQDGRTEHLVYNQSGIPCVSCSKTRPNHRALIPGPCRCNEIVIAQLSLLPALLHHECCAFDVELVQFQEAIKLCAGVLACTCAAKDYTSVLTISMLIARILSVFERGGTRPGYGGGVDFMGGGRASKSPKFSLGLYQIEGEDEQKLKQEVWRFQLKKVQSLVTGFKEMVMKITQLQVYQDVVQAAAWEKLSELLDQKAEVLKRDWAADRYKD